MPEVIDWQRTPDPAAAIRRAAEALRGGQIVGVPTESGYHLAASIGSRAAVARLLGAGANGEPLVVALGGAEDLLDWLPRLGRIGQRLARRSWPGALQIESDAGVAEGLAGQLPAEVRQGICPADVLRLQVPAGAVTAGIGYELGEPLILGPPSYASAAELPATAGDHPTLVFDDGPRSAAAVTVVRIDGESWQIVRRGSVTEEQLNLRSACLVIFVCTGNTCRSPLAAALFRKRLAERLGCAVAELPGRGFFVLSAGLAAMMGAEATAEAVMVATEFGADLSGHGSRPLAPELAAQADFLIAMTRDHADALTYYFPHLGATPRLLDPAGGDIADPIGQPQEVYRVCGEQIWQSLEPLLAEVAPGLAASGAGTEVKEGI